VDPFELPAELPVDVAELTELREAATAEITRVTGLYENEGDLSEDNVAYLSDLLDAVETLNGAIAEASTDDDEHRTAVSKLVARAQAATAAADDDADADDDDEDGDDADDDDEAESEDEGGEVVEAEVVEADREPVGAAPVAARTTRSLAAGRRRSGSRREISFRGVGRQEAPAGDSGPGWVVVAGAPGFQPDEIGQRVGFARMGQALDSVRKGHGVGKLNGRLSGMKMRQPVGQMTRALPEATDQRSLVDLINTATDQRNLPGGSLIAAGGWCAPSEQLYDFCDVPEATDLISLPEVAINRGGLRWPVEPDMTALFENFEFFFTEPELEAVDGSGNPTAVKHCIEIPCPDEFEEIRLNAVGYCVEAGILQRQGWPESIEYVLRSLTQEHLRAMSRRTIRDMWNGGNPVKVFSANLQVGATSSVLNSIALYATNLRLNRGLSRTAVIEGVAPSWFFEVLRADMAMQQGIDTNSVSDEQILSWLRDRHVAFQFVGDWQTRSPGLPGHLDTVAWPPSVDIMMYPAGTWFRSLSNIIEVGVMYPKEQLQINRYTEFFTEDAIAIGKRCGVSANLRIPLCVNGGYGAPVEITCSEPAAPDFGDPVPGTAPGGGTDGQHGLPTVSTIEVTGTPTGGSFEAFYLGEKFTVAFNESAASLKTKLVALKDGLGEDDFTVTGGPLPGNDLVVTAKGGGKITIGTKSLTGGTSPDVTVS